MIHPTAFVSKNADIGADVNIGPYSIIHDNVKIGDNCTIDSYCEIGYPSRLAKRQELIIGDNSLIRSHSVFYMGSVFKSGLKTGHHVTVRENTTAGLDLQIGTFGDIQGDCELGDCVRMHSNVHIAKCSEIGDFVWMFSYVSLHNDPHPPSYVLKGVIIKDYAVIASKATILPGVSVGEHSLVGAHSCVTSDIKPYSLCYGVPAKERGDVRSLEFHDGSGRKAYPWPRHFNRGYPDKVVEAWLNNALFEKMANE